MHACSEFQHVAAARHVRARVRRGGGWRAWGGGWCACVCVRATHVSVGRAVFVCGAGVCEHAAAARQMHRAWGRVGVCQARALRRSSSTSVSGTRHC